MTDQYDINDRTSPIRIREANNTFASSMSNSLTNPNQTAGSKIAAIKHAIKEDENQIPLFGEDTSRVDNNLTSGLAHARTLDEQCQKLRVNYTEHRKQRKGSRSRGRSNENISLDTKPSTFNNFTVSQKENHTIEAPSYNRFKRTQNKETLEKYQSKYAKLEENFKKFTKTLKDKGASRSPDVVATRQPQSHTIQVNDYSRQPLSPLTTTVQLKQVIMAPSGQTNSDAFFADQPISDRRLALSRMLTQTENFLNLSFTKLQSIAVSRAQENDLCQAHESIMAQLKAIEESGEVERLEAVLQAIMTRIDSSFTQVLRRVYQIESSTFLNYKFRDVLSFLHLMLEESYRLKVTELMPSLCETVRNYKVQAGQVLLNSIFKKRRTDQTKLLFKKWNDNAFRLKRLDRSLSSIYRRKSKRLLAQSYLKWQGSVVQLKSALQKGPAVANLLLDETNLNECISSEQQMAFVLLDWLKKEHGVQAELILTAEDQENDIFLIPDRETGELHHIAREAAVGSVTQRALDTGDEFNVINNLFASRNFNEIIDRPFFTQNDIRDLKHDQNVIIVPLRPATIAYQKPQQSKPCVGLLRIYSIEQFKNQDKETLRMIAKEVTAFVIRAGTLREQLRMMGSDLAQKTEALQVADYERAIHKVSYEILTQLHMGSRDDFMSLVRNKVQRVLQMIMPQTDPNLSEETFLRQIFLKSEGALQQPAGLLSDDPLQFKKTLVKTRDHFEEKQDILIDYLDYQADLLVLQMSIDLRTGHENNFCFVIHRLLSFDTNNTNRPAQVLSETTKHLLKVLVRDLEPILVQGLAVHEELGGSLARQAGLLHRQGQMDQLRNTMRHELADLGSENQKEGFEKVQNVLQGALSFMVDSDKYTVVEMGMLLSEELFVASEERSETDLLFGYMDEGVQTFMNLPQPLVQTLDLNCSKITVPSSHYIDCAQQIQAIQSTPLLSSPVSNSNNVTIQSQQNQQFMIQIPILQTHTSSSEEQPLLCFMKLKIESKLNAEQPSQTLNAQTDLKYFAATLAIEFGHILSQIHRQTIKLNYFSDCTSQLRKQINNLTLDMDFVQQVQSNLVLPFTKVSSIQTLASGLLQLANMFIPLGKFEQISLLRKGRLAWQYSSPDMTRQQQQEQVSSPKNTSSDMINLTVRGQQFTYSQSDQMIFSQNQSNLQAQEATLANLTSKWTDQAIEILDNQIIIRLITQNMPKTCIALQMSNGVQMAGPGLDAKESNANLVHQCEVFQVLVEPFVSVAVQSLNQSLMPSKKEPLARALYQILSQKKMAHAYSLFIKLKELEVYKVPIFTRLNSFKHVLEYVQLAKRQDMIDQNQIVNNAQSNAFIGLSNGIVAPTQEYREEDKEQFEEHKQVLLIYAATFQRMNTYAMKIKNDAFQSYKSKILQAMHMEQATLQYIASYQPSKLQRKAISTLKRLQRKICLRALFCNLAILSQVSRRLNNPHNKKFTAALCIMHNFNRMRSRLAVQKMRGHAVDKVYRDFAGVAFKDKEVMQNLQTQLLIHQHQQQTQEKINPIFGQNQDGVLEQGVTGVLEQALTYLQESLLPETLDLIVVTIFNQEGSKARAYVFNTKMSGAAGHGDMFNGGLDMDISQDDVMRMEHGDVVDQVTAENLHMDVKNLQDFDLSYSKDVILQMLLRSKTMFNFKDIKKSLYDLYIKNLTATGQMGDSRVDINSRLCILRKAKSALISPLLLQQATSGVDEAIFYDDQTKQKLVGSLEFYRFNGLSFDDEFEQRIKIFKQGLSNVLQVYLSVRHSQIQLSEMQLQLQLSHQGPSNLTSVLRQLQSSAPKLINAPHVLCLVLTDHLAYFYQFKDNFTYKFEYKNTFVEEIVESGLVMELTCSGMSSNQNEPSGNLDTLEATEEMMMFASKGLPQTMTNSDPRVQGTRRKLVMGLKSVTNITGFKHIFYYPVFSQQTGAIEAILEVGYHTDQQVPTEIYGAGITKQIESLGSQLGQLKLKLRAFLKTVGLIVDKQDARVLARAFYEWRNDIIMEDQKEDYNKAQQKTVAKTEECFGEYVKSLESYDQELRKLTDEKAALTQEVTTLRKDRVAKFKLLGATLMMLTHLQKSYDRNKLSQAFLNWKHHANVNQVAESAFNKMLELNYRHANSRFEAAAYLLKKSAVMQAKRAAFENVLSFANFTHLKIGQNSASGYKRQSGYGNYADHLNGSDITQRMMSQNNMGNFSGSFAPSHSNNNNGNHFSNVVGPFNKSVIQQPFSHLMMSPDNNTNIGGNLGPGSEYANIQLNQNTNHGGLSKGNGTPVITNINLPENRLKKIHKKLGLGAVPKESSKRETGSAGRQNRKRSRSNSGSRTAPMVNRVIM